MMKLPFWSGIGIEPSGNSVAVTKSDECGSRTGGTGRGGRGQESETVVAAVAEGGCVAGVVPAWPYAHWAKTTANRRETTSAKARPEFCMQTLCTNDRNASIGGADRATRRSGSRVKRVGDTLGYDPNIGGLCSIVTSDSFDARRALKMREVKVKIQTSSSPRNCL
jgi:hypothetical protein